MSPLEPSPTVHVNVLAVPALVVIAVVVALVVWGLHRTGLLVPLGGLLLLLVLAAAALFWVHVAEEEPLSPLRSRTQAASNPDRIQLDEPQDPRLASTGEKPVAPPGTTDQPSANHPAWFDEPTRRIGSVYRTTAHSDPYATVAECHTAIDAQLEEIASRYVDELLGQGVGAQLGLSAAYVRRRVCHEEWVEPVHSPTLSDLSAGPVYRLHMLLEFDDAVRAELTEMWHQRLLARRLGQMGRVALAVLASLATLLGYLKLDTATKGFYTRRLQLAAVALILAIVGLGFWAA